MLSPGRRLLYEDGRQIGLIPRYFDLLVLLVDQRHRAVHRQEIFDCVWADVVVSDGALTQAIRTIRRVLGDDPREPVFIRTVSRHGYQFVWAPVVEEADQEPVAGPAEARAPAEPARTDLHAPASADPFEPLIAVLLREGAGAGATDDERHDAAVRLHELGTEEALRRLDARPGHEEARALLRDARWDAPSAGEVPLLREAGRTWAVLDVVALRFRHAARLASARWASAAVGAAAAGLAAGTIGGAILSLLPDSVSGIRTVVALALVGGAAGAAGGAGIGAGLAAAEALARSARAFALVGAGAVAGLCSGALAHQAVRTLVSGIFGGEVDALAGGVEGLAMGAAIGAGYALATRRLPQGGMAAPRGRARWRTALVTGGVAAAAGVALALAGRHLVGSSLDVMADIFAGSQVGLDALARMLGEDSLRPLTRALVAAFEGLLFGAGLAFGLTRRPRAPVIEPM